MENWVWVFRDDLRKALLLFALRKAKLGLFWQKKRGKLRFPVGFAGWFAASAVGWALCGFPFANGLSL